MQSTDVLQPSRVVSTHVSAEYKTRLRNDCQGSGRMRVRSSPFDLRRKALYRRNCLLSSKLPEFVLSSSEKIIGANEVL